MTVFVRMSQLAQVAMGIVHPSHRISFDWLADGPVGPYIHAFKQHLTGRGYARHALTGYLASIVHFARRARCKRLRTHLIDESAIAEFLDGHLPNCSCAGACSAHPR